MAPPWASGGEPEDEVEVTTEPPETIALHVGEGSSSGAHAASPPWPAASPASPDASGGTVPPSLERAPSAGAAPSVGAEPSVVKAPSAPRAPPPSTATPEPPLLHAATTHRPAQPRVAPRSSELRMGRGYPPFSS